MNFQLRFTHGDIYEHTLGKIVCVGRNYAAHAKELNNPVPKDPILFIKPESSAVKLSEPIRLPKYEACHYEAELAILIGARLTCADEAEVDAGIVGVGLALDLTLRALQAKLKEKGHPWEVAKSFDAACPMSDFVPRHELSDLDQLQFTLTINDKLRQRGLASEMITPIVPLIAFISQHFTLKPGDVVLTGTPEGVGQLFAGDQLSLVLGEQFNVQTVVC